MEEQFNKFYNNIKLTKKQREDAKIKYSGVCKTLHEFYYPDINYNGSTKLLFGSYGKHTNIRPPRDVDVLFIMPPEKFEQYNDNSSNSQSQLLQDVKKILSEKYSTTDKIKGWGKVVLVQFADGCHNVELLPAWQNNNKFIIPNSEDNGSWEDFDPKNEIEQIKEANNANNKKVIPVIRMIKKWAEKCTVNIKSCLIEEYILRFFSQSNSDNNYSILLRDAFDFLQKAITDDNIKSHLQTAYIRARKACEYEDKGNIDKATAEWQKIFGSIFPNQKSVTSFNNELHIPKHCEALKWPYKQEGQLELQASIYFDNKKKIVRDIVSNDVQLDKNFDIKFTTKTNINNGEIKYYWQVVNNGTEAENVIKKDGTKGDLRGEILPGSELTWEKTAYTGRHWVECFIVRDGKVCIAKSGKFIINIK